MEVAKQSPSAGRDSRGYQSMACIFLFLVAFPLSIKTVTNAGLT
jgi:hypothetical protein